MRPAWISGNSTAPQIECDVVPQRGQPAAIEFPHAAQVPPEMPFYDEVAEYSFKVCRRVRISLVAEREKTLHEGLRQHQVAKS